MTATRMESVPARNELERLGKASRRTALLSVLGLVVFLGSFVFGGTQVTKIQREQARLLVVSDSTTRALGQARDSLRSVRCALATSRAAIAAFQRGRFRDAVALYDEALSCDSTNAYILNLRAYSAFKSGDLAAAIASQRRSLAVDSTYAWGYMDLARFLCAEGQGNRVEAEQAARRAIALRADMLGVMRGDGELQHLCGAAFVGSLR